jgi:hypothetical protein
VKKALSEESSLALRFGNGTIERRPLTIPVPELEGVATQGNTHPAAVLSMTVTLTASSSTAEPYAVYSDRMTG